MLSNEYTFWASGGSWVNSCSGDPTLEANFTLTTTTLRAVVDEGV